MTVSVGTGVSIGNLVTSTVDPDTGGSRLSAGDKDFVIGSPASRLVIWGDSFAMTSTTTTTPTSASASGGVVTIVKTAHGLYNGQRMNHIGFSQPLANVFDSLITRIDANSYSYSAPGLADGALSSGAGWQSVAADYYSQARIGSNISRRSKAAFDVSKSAGLGSHRTDQTLAYLDYVRSLRPDVLAIVEGYNDIAQGIAKEVTLANIVAKINAFPGVPKLVSSLSPWLAGATANGATGRQKVVWINKQLAALCRQLPGCYFIDIYSKSVNPLTGLAKAGWISATDSIHPTAIWADTWAQMAIAALAGDNLKPHALTASFEDNKATDATNTNLNPNAPWTNTGGNAGGFGTAAAGVTIARETGTPGVIASVVTDSEGVGYAQRVVITPGAASDQVRITFALTAADFVAGASLFVKAKINTVNFSTSNCSQVFSQFIFVDDTGTRTIWDGIGSPVTGEFIQSDYVDAVIGWDGLKVPNAPLTLARFDVVVKFSAASVTPMTLDVSRVSTDQM